VIAGPAKMPVCHRKPGGLDDMGFHVQAGAQTQNRAGVLRNVRLEKGKTHANKTLLIA